MIKVQKFPDLFLEGKKIIWDWRQDLFADELIYLNPENSESNARKKLIERHSNKTIVDAQSNVDLLGLACREATQNADMKLKILGVTGTNGKTTSVNLLRHLMGLKGHRVAQLGTEGLSLWQNLKCVYREETGWTTPPAPILHDLFFQLERENYTAIVMEVSSHALVLGRVGGVDFDGAQFTNLTQDHLDFHKTMQAYAEAKKSFFTKYLSNSNKDKKAVVVNGSDSIGQHIISELPLGMRCPDLLLQDQSI